MKKSIIVKIISAFMVFITLFSVLAISVVVNADAADFPLDRNNNSLKTPDQIYYEANRKTFINKIKNTVKREIIPYSYTIGWKGKALDKYIDYMYYEFASGKCYFELCDIFESLCDSLNKRVDQEMKKYSLLERTLTIFNFGGRKDKLLNYAVEKACDDMINNMQTKYSNAYKSKCEAAARWAKAELGRCKASSLLTK